MSNSDDLLSLVRIPFHELDRVIKVDGRLSQRGRVLSNWNVARTGKLRLRDMAISYYGMTPKCGAYTFSWTNGA